jgi:membrane protein YdbS with pleckstrin-like domain
MKYLEDYIFRLNWFKLIEPLSKEQSQTLIPVLVLISSYAAAFTIILAILCFLLMWIVVIVSLVPYLVIVPFYRILGRKYIVYEFFPKMLVVHKGIFVKTRKAYPYRSITATN